jgi:hypothetical protein
MAEKPSSNVKTTDYKSPEKIHSPVYDHTSGNPTTKRK